MKYRVFKRTWWKDNPSWPNGLEPCAGEKKTIGWFFSEKQAQEYCKRFNETTDSGRYSLKAEYEEA